MKCMVADLCAVTGLHKNTIYGLLNRGIIKPVEVISGVNIFSDDTVASIKKHYGRLGSQCCKKRITTDMLAE